jgi:hypothetical protein
MKAIDLEDMGKRLAEHRPWSAGECHALLALAREAAEAKKTSGKFIGVTVLSENEKAYEWDVAMRNLDSHGVPRSGEEGVVLSLWGRITELLAEAAGWKEDAERLHHLTKRLGVSTDGNYTFCLPLPHPVSNVMRGSIVEHFYAAIDADAAREKGNG